MMIFLGFYAWSQTTLQQCQEAAEKNYPLIKQHDLIKRTAELTVSNLGKSWLPQVALNAQATLQSDVTSWPQQMQSLLNQMGVEIKGLKKDQYRVGLDVSQMLYDGGAIRSQQQIARLQGQLESAQNDVNLYAIKQRVNEMYYGLLLLEAQLLLNKDVRQLWESNEKKLASLFRRGAAAECDYLAVKAERINSEQQGIELQSQRNTLAHMLSLFCGIDVNEVVMPDVDEANLNAVNQRPELKLIETQLRLTDAQLQSINTQLRPRVSLFASGFYGYPGYNMFEDMMTHKWSLNGMLGAKVTWNMGAFYTRKNDMSKVSIRRDMAENNREVFLFNNRLEQTKSAEAITRYRQLLEKDNEIINLRTSVRKAAESKLNHGIIEVNDFIKEINAENYARVQHAIHRIELLKSMSELKYSLNN